MTKIKVKNSENVIPCPYCGYRCDPYDGEYPSLRDDVCPHLRKIIKGVAYFTKKWRPSISLSYRY